MAFPIKCGDCQKSFSISEEVYDRKVRGKQVTIKCKSCGAAIRVDGTKERTATASSVPPPKGEPAAPEQAVKSPPGSVAGSPASGAKKPGELKVGPAPVAKSLASSKAGTTPKGVLGNVTSKAASSPMSKAAETPSPRKAAPAPSAKVSAAGLGKAAPKASTHQGLISSPTKPAATRALRADAGAELKNRKPSSALAQPLTSKRRADALKPAASGLGAGGRTSPKAASGAGAQVRAPAAPVVKPATPSSPKQPTPLPAVTGTGRQSVPTFEAEDSMLWAVDYGESEHRELTTEEIAREIENGAIDGQTLVWHDNMPDWLAIRDVKELRGFVEAEPVQKPGPPPLQAPTSGKGLPSVPEAAPLPPLGPLSSRASIGSPASRPPAPPKKSRPEDNDNDEVVTSARLIEDGDKGADPFADLASAPIVAAPPSLNDPFAAPPAAPARPAAPPAAPPVAPAPQALGVGAGAMAPFGAPPVAPAGVPPAAGLAPVASPSPAALAAPAATGFGAAPAMPAPAAPPPMMGLPGSGGVDDLEWPQARRKKPLVLGALGVAAVALVAWLLLSGSDSPPEPPPVDTQSSPARAPAAPEPPAPTPTSAPAPEPQPEPATTSASDRPPPKGGGFADMFEQGAKGTD